MSFEPSGGLGEKAQKGIKKANARSEKRTFAELLLIKLCANSSGVKTHEL